MITRPPRLVVFAAVWAVLAGAVGCAHQDTAPDGRPQVVASTDVWAGVVRAVAGNTVKITTIIDDPARDPHSYEASTADAADVAGADLVVFNGGGYDEFMDRFLNQSGHRPAVEAVAVAKAEHHGDSANEHVWYDLPVVAAVARQVAEQLGRLVPARAGQFTAAAATFGRGIDGLNAKVAGIAEQHAGTTVAMTEPVAFFLVEAAKLDDLTPPQFTEAVEEENDPPAAAVAATRDLLTKRQVRVLIYNPQTETPIIRQLRDTAKNAGIPTVTMTETIPTGSTYLTWMSGQIDALSVALR